MMRRVFQVVLGLCLFTAVQGRNLGFDKIIFVKRHTYTANHYYTEYLNSQWLPGGNLCTFDLKTGQVAELVPELKRGVFERFDLDFDAKHIVFAWKRSAGEGYRLYEIGIDPKTGARVGELKQLTRPPEEEAALVERYAGAKGGSHYHHGTDDMHPCYLPDGGIVFISTRCQYGVLCDAPDLFTTTVLYRIDRDGSNMRPISFGALSEASPTILPDGRIMYTRWEYVDKGAVSVKGLWAMRPDGSASVEIYGNDIALPPTMLYGRPIPGRESQYVMNGTPHCPQNGVGTVIKVDMTKNIRTREPMVYVTPDVDIRSEGGFHFKIDGKWVRDGAGRKGRLFKEPYPLSGEEFLVAYKPKGFLWKDPGAYHLALLDENGGVEVLYEDPEMSCFEPFPLQPRKRPPVLNPSRDTKLAEQDLATCVVTDVYQGLTGIKRGEAKFIRINQQIPRFWSARRNWDGDVYDQQHAVVSKDASLGLKVQEGIVPIEKDGSAHFLVPANANIFFQVLDENYMELQRERTFVNYLPGETRTCVGCHETPEEVSPPGHSTPLALRRAPSVPGPQQGEKSGRRTLFYERDVQPAFDRHCVECHRPEKKDGDLDLSGGRTELFSVSYESLMPERRRNPRRDPQLLGPIIGENHRKTGFDDGRAEAAYGTPAFREKPGGYPTGNSVHYFPPKSIGSHTSKLVKLIREGHEDVKIPEEDFVRLVTWIDSNGQYYGSYYGRRNLRYKDHPNFRPDHSYEQAICPTPPLPEEER